MLRKIRSVYQRLAIVYKCIYFVRLAIGFYIHCYKYLYDQCIVADERGS